jgi:hypothetical protein
LVALSSAGNFLDIVFSFCFCNDSEEQVIYTDSNATVEFFKHYKNSRKLKHLLKLLHGIRLAINENKIRLVFINSEFNVADGLTSSSSSSSS